jgi:hypothetical protein
MDFSLSASASFLRLPRCVVGDNERKLKIPFGHSFTSSRGFALGFSVENILLNFYQWSKRDGKSIYQIVVRCWLGEGSEEEAEEQHS